jgi:lactate permease
MGPMLPDVIASIASIFSVLLVLKFWKPKTVWRFNDETISGQNHPVHHTASTIFRAWAPFILLTVMVLFWGLQPVRDKLDHLGSIQFNIPWLHNRIQSESGNLLAQVFKFNFLSASGTAIFISVLISIPLIGIRFKEAVKVFLLTLNQLKFAIITIASILGFAYITNNSGMSNTLAAALANTGFLFPFFSPILGWLGVFITGSDTSSNALFCKLQQTTATSIGVDPVITVAANCSGGVVAKMISPQSIAVAAAAGGLTGKESQLFAFTVKHSFIMLGLICLIVMAQAYLLNWMVPVNVPNIGTENSLKHDATTGYLYLLALGVILIGIVSMVILTAYKKRTLHKP